MRKSESIHDAGRAKLAGVILGLAVLAWASGGRPAEPGSESTALESEELGPKVHGVHLPDQPGTVPLQEVLREGREDAEMAQPKPSPVEPGEARPGNLPPLSLQDCQTVMRWAQARLAKKEEGSASQRHSEVTPGLEQVLDYLKILDERHSTLADYDWVFVSQEKVSGTPTDEDTFQNKRINDVSAVSFQTENGDARLHSVVILNDEGKKVAEYNLDPPITLRAGLPRREVFHLYFPTPIQRVVVRYEAVNPKDKPRVSLYAGLTSGREYLKQAQFYLRRTVEALQNNQAAEANEMLTRASQRVAKFQKRY